MTCLIRFGESSRETPHCLENLEGYRHTQAVGIYCKTARRSHAEIRPAPDHEGDERVLGPFHGRVRNRGKSGVPDGPGSGREGFWVADARILGERLCQGKVNGKPSRSQPGTVASVDGSGTDTRSTATIAKRIGIPDDLLADQRNCNTALTSQRSRRSIGGAMSTKLDKMRQKNGSGQIAAAEKPSEPPKPAKVP